MSAAAPLLTLVQRLSPAFPVGGFAYSHGLETVMAAGEIGSAGALAAWIADVIARGSGRQDAILLCHALRQGADLARLAEMARALAATRERRVEAEDQGRAFLSVTRALDGGGPAEDLPYPLAVGAALAGQGMDPTEVAALFLQAFAGNLVQAGVRFIPLGQTEGQLILSGLHPLILRVAAEAAAAGLDDLGGAALGSDLAAARHETLEVRIFRT